METLILVGIAFVFGGVLKGALGVGAPLAAVPLLSLLYGVPFAVAVFVMPNLGSNLWQAFTYARKQPDKRLVWLFAAGGGVGAVCGSYLLVSLPAFVLNIILASIVGLYLLFKVFRPQTVLSSAATLKLAFPVGWFAGVMQGAAGLSAPVSVTFLRLAGLERQAFIATISIFFLGLGFVQLPALILLDVMDWRLFLLSCAALAPLLLGMVLGNWIFRRLNAAWFDRAVSMVLAAIAVLLLVRGLSAL